MKKPCLIDFKNVPSLKGDLSIIEIEKILPFGVKRIFWLSKINDFSVERGFHAHKNTEQFLICLQGKVEFYSELPDGEKFNVILSNESNGVYIPPNAWHYMKYEPSTIQLVLSSSLYEESDYLRNFSDFQQFYKNNIN